MTETAPEEPGESRNDIEKGENKEEGCCAVNKVYLVSKGFYFFFFSAQGSLLPYLALFFKQLELPASQIGAVTGIKPYIAFFFIPFWGCVADRFKKGKILFVISMIAIIAGMVAYAFVPISICETEPTEAVSARAIPQESYRNTYSGKRYIRAARHTSLPFPVAQNGARSTTNMNTQAGVNAQVKKKTKSKRGGLFFPRVSHISELIKNVSPMEGNRHFDQFSEQLKVVQFNLESGSTARIRRNNLTNSLDSVSQMAEESLEETPWSQSDMIALQGQKSKKTPSRKNTFIFLYLLLATILTTVLSCPSLTLADTATVNLLKQNDDTHKYGKQRMWGSIGYGSMAFLVGAAVSRTHLCPPGSARRKDVNYYPCFAMYVVYNTIALVIGSRFEFNNNGKTSNQETDGSAKSTKDETKEKANSGTRGIIAGLLLLTRPRHAMFLVTAFYVGITMGFIRVFLFWHLKDLGGTQILFSIMTAINCVAEVTLYFLSTRLISFLGTVRVLYLGLTCYAIRLFYYAFVTNPWTVLPIELLSGITTAAVWAAMMSYVGTHSVEGASVTLQGKHSCVVMLKLFLKAMQIDRRTPRILYYKKFSTTLHNIMAPSQGTIEYIYIK